MVERLERDIKNLIEEKKNMRSLNLRSKNLRMSQSERKRSTNHLLNQPQILRLLRKQLYFLAPPVHCHQHQEPALHHIVNQEEMSQCLSQKVCHHQFLSQWSCSEHRDNYHSCYYTAYKCLAYSLNQRLYLLLRTFLPDKHF